MSDWRATPFENLEQAHAFAEASDLKPYSIATDLEKGFRYFVIRDKRKTQLVAQALTGGPVQTKDISIIPQMQDPAAPRWSSDDAYITAGPWMHDRDFENLEEVEAHWRREVLNFEDSCEVMRGKYLAFLFNNDIHQYVELPDGRVLVRALVPAHR